MQLPPLVTVGAFLENGHETIEVVHNSIVRVF